MGRPFPPDKPHETSIGATLMLIPTLLIPLALVKTYQLIPAKWRRRMFPGPSASQAAIDAMADGANGWTAIRSHARITW